MKKFLLATCVAALAFFATSCYQSTVKDLGDGLASFTKYIDKSTEYVGVKNTVDGSVVVEPVYEVVYYEQGIIIAAKANNYSIYNTAGERIFENLKIKEIYRAPDYLEIQASGGKYIYFRGLELLGPFGDYAYYPGYDLLFATNAGGKYGAYTPHSGEQVVDHKYAQIVFAIDEGATVAYYVSNGKTTRRLANGKEVSANLAQLKKEASAKKTPWPKEGCSVVLVKSIK